MRCTRKSAPSSYKFKRVTLVLSLKKIIMAKPIKAPLLTEMLYAGSAARRREITKLFEEDPAFSKLDRPFKNHTQR